MAGFIKGPERFTKEISDSLIATFEQINIKLLELEERVKKLVEKEYNNI